MRWGLLSTAHINEAILGGADATEEATVVAVASRDRPRAEAYAREHGIERAHGSYEALLEDPDVDAVYVSLPNSMHVPWSIKALEAGKHVLCEKPLTRRAEEAEEVFAVAERSGRLLAEGFMWRHHPQVARLHELLNAGTIGRLRLVRAAFSFPIADQDDIRMSAELNGGSLMDVGCYCLSGTRVVTGAEPERVVGEQVMGGDGVDIAFSAVLRYPGDVVGQFDCGFAVAKRGELVAVGEEGTITLDDPWHGRTPTLEIAREDGVEQVEVEPANSYTLELEDFARAARGEGEPLLGREDAVAQARVIEALYRSADEGRAVAP